MFLLLLILVQAFPKSEAGSSAFLVARFVDVVAISR